MNRSTIRSRAQKLLGEPSSGYWSDTDYDQAIQDGAEDIALRTKCLKTYAEFSTSESTLEYDFSEDSLANFISLAEVWFFRDTDIYDRLIRVSRDKLSILQSEYRGRSGYPTCYCYEDRVLELECTTDADLTVRVYYYKLPATMTEDADIPGIPTKFHQSIIYYVCWKFAESGGTEDENKIIYFRNQYLESLTTLKETINDEGYHVIDDTITPYYE